MSEITASSIKQPDREPSFPRLQAVMPVTKLVLKRSIQIINGELAVVVPGGV